MKIAYLDCISGISGDMTLGALVDAGVPLEAIQDGIDSLGLPDCRLEAEDVKRKGFRATKVHVRLFQRLTKLTEQRGKLFPGEKTLRLLHP